jgi:hypothetical protein
MYVPWASPDFLFNALTPGGPLRVALRLVASESPSLLMRRHVPKFVFDSGPDCRTLEFLPDDPFTLAYLQQYLARSCCVQHR